MILNNGRKVLLQDIIIMLSFCGYKLSSPHNFIPTDISVKSWQVKKLLIYDRQRVL